jgi:hypothetical protein
MKGGKNDTKGFSKRSYDDCSRVCLQSHLSHSIIMARVNIGVRTMKDIIFKKYKLHSQEIRRIPISIVLLSVFTIAALIFNFENKIKPAAANTLPSYGHAWYITNADTSTNGKMYLLGTYDGQWDNATCTNNLWKMVILNFGQVSYQAGGGYGGYGTLTMGYPYPFVSNSTILVAAERYIQGFWANTGSCPHLKVVLGVNNYNQCPNGGACSPSSAGAQWGNLVNDLNSWVSSQNYQAYISVLAGSDMEQPSGTQNWDCFPKTQSFVDGFGNNDPSGALFYDYGTAWVPNSCWNASQVYYVAYQAPKDYPIPEIYFQSALNSWTGLGYFMYYPGELTTCNQSDTIGTYCTAPSGWWGPSTAWTNLKNAISQTDLSYSSNIRYQSAAPGQQ